MLIEYFSGDPKFFAHGFWNSTGFGPRITSGTSTQWNYSESDYGITKTVIGYNLSLDGFNLPFGDEGNITSIEFQQNGVLSARMSGFDFLQAAFTNHVSIALHSPQLLNDLLNGEPITIDARAATQGLQDIEEVFTLTARLTIKGSEFDDTIVGKSGNDVLYGFKGDDSIYDGSGNDRVKGGAGHDFLFNGMGSDRLNGGAGIDTLVDDISVWRVDLGVVFVNLSTGKHSFANLSEVDTLSHIENYKFIGGTDVIATGNDGANTLRTGAGSDFLSGRKGHDLLFAGSGGDVLKGGNGNDRLLGGNGNDSLRGEKGDDFLAAGKGRDHLFGGQGSDVFMFNDIALQGYNRIADFEDGVDMISLRNSSGFSGVKIEAQNAGADTLLTFTGGTRVLLQNIDAGDITVDDFNFL